MNIIRCCHPMYPLRHKQEAAPAERNSEPRIPWLLLQQQQRYIIRPTYHPLIEIPFTAATSLPSLSGVIPKELANLPSLVHLVLGDNCLGGESRQRVMISCLEV